MKMKIKERKIVKESLVLSANSVIPELLPSGLFRGSDSQSKEKLKATIEDLIKTLNKFYEEHDIDWKIKR